MWIRALHCRLLSGILLFALLLQTLLPAMVGAAGPAERWIEVCAASGVKWVKPDPASSEVSHAASDHCTLCAATGATPEFDAGRFLTSSLQESPPSGVTAAPFETFPSHLLRSRAPPRLS